MIARDAGGNAIDTAALSAVIAGGLVEYSLELLHEGQALEATVKRLSLTLGTTADAGGDTAGFVVGGAYSNQATAELHGLSGSLVGETLQIVVGVKVGNATVRIPVAGLMVTDQQRVGDISTLTMAGAVNALMTSAGLGLSDGFHTVSEIIAATNAASGASVSLDSAFSSLGGTEVYVYAGMTCRAALDALAASLGGFACDSNTWPDVRVSAYADTPTCEVDAGTMTALPRVGSEYEVTGLTVTADGETAYTYGDGRVQVDFQDVKQATAAVMWANLQGYCYDPCTVQVGVLNPLVTPFDRVEFEDGSDTREFPALGIQARYDGGYFGTIEAAGIAEEAERAVEKGAVSAKLDLTSRVAKEAQEAAQATNQHFWHRSEDAGDDGAGTGAFVTDMPQDEFLTGAASNFADLTDSKPYHNVLINSLGMLIRRGKTQLASLTKSAIAFYDGLGNAASNVVASFSKNGAQIGMNTDTHITIDKRQLSINAGTNSTLLDDYFNIGFANDENGLCYVQTVNPNATVLQDGTIEYDLIYPIELGDHLRDAMAIGTEGSATSSYGLYSQPTADGFWADQYGRVFQGADFATEHPDFELHAIQFYTTADVLRMRMGPTSEARGDYTIALGNTAIAEGVGAVAIGNETWAEGNWQTALGCGNVPDNEGEYVLIVGNGTLYGERSNAFTVDWYGNVSAAGEVSAVDENDTVHNLTEKLNAGPMLYLDSVEVTIASTAHGANRTATGHAALGGCTPIGVVGWRWDTTKSHSRENWFSFYRIDADTDGTVTVSACNTHATDAAYGTLVVYVLMGKDEVTPGYWDGGSDYYAPADHTHDAEDTVSGVFDDARIPELTAAQTAALLT